MKQKNYFKNFSFVCYILLILIIASNIFAGNVNIPNIFTAGDTASASKVNENFSVLEGATNSNTSEVETNKAKIATHDSTIAINTEDINANKAAIEDNSAKINTNTTDISKIKTDIEKNTSDIAKNTDDIATLSGNSIFNQNTSILRWQNISTTNIDVRTSAVNVATVALTAPSSGNILVRFDGMAYITGGDRLVVAASNTSATWGVNDGNVSLYNASTTAIQSFSHTRVYPVTAGNYSFYAVAHNYVNLGGNGIVSIYGMLTVEFFPN